MLMVSTPSQRKFEPSKKLPNHRTRMSSRPKSDCLCTMAILCLTCLLLYQDVCWHWTSKQQRAFTKSKQLLTSAKVPIQYDPEPDLVVTKEASAYRVSAVFTQAAKQASCIHFQDIVTCGTELLSSGERSFGVCLC